jgi:hypothetical protein
MGDSAINEGAIVGLTIAKTDTSNFTKIRDRLALAHLQEFLVADLDLLAPSNDAPL